MTLSISSLVHTFSSTKLIDFFLQNFAFFHVNILKERKHTLVQLLESQGIASFDPLFCNKSIQLYGNPRRTIPYQTNYIKYVHM